MAIKAINVRSQFMGTIKEVVQGGALAEIDVRTAAGIVTSVITFVKSIEVSIAKR